MHWIQLKKSQPDRHLIIKVKRCARSSSNAPSDQDLHYYVLPNDPVAALNILREAAGLEPWSDTDDRPVPDLSRHE